MPHVNKKTTSEKWKFGSNKKLGIEWTMNGLGKPFLKNPIQKIENNSKKQCEKTIAACDQKIMRHVTKPSEKAKYCSNTVFSLYFFTIRAKSLNFSKTQNNSLFRSTSCVGVTKITTPTWLQKSWKFMKKIFKKDSAPNKIKFFAL